MNKDKLHGADKGNLKPKLLKKTQGSMTQLQMSMRHIVMVQNTLKTIEHTRLSKDDNNYKAIKIPKRYKNSTRQKERKAKHTDEKFRDQVITMHLKAYLTN